jgi:hypothetical protein
MSRQIISSAFSLSEGQRAYRASVTANAPNLPADRYKDRIIKLIPGEVVAVYLFLSGLIASTDPAKIPQDKLLTIVFLILLALTWPYLSRIAGVSNRTQVAISTVAFAVWVFSLGGPFPYLMGLVGWKYQPIYGGIILPLYTFAVPILDNSYTGPPK